MSRSAIQKNYTISVAVRSVTLSTSKYSEYYFADLTLTTTRNLIGIIPIESTENQFAYAQIENGTVVIVYGTKSGGTIKLRLVFAD